MIEQPTFTDRTRVVAHVSAPGHVVHHAYVTTWLASGNVAVSDPYCGSRRRNGWANVPGTERTTFCDKRGCTSMAARECPECAK